MVDVIYFTKYTDKGPSSRYRSYQYKEYLENEFSIIYYPLFDDDYIVNLYENKSLNFSKLFVSYVSRFYQVMKYMWSDKIIFIEYELLPYFPPILEFLLDKTNVKIILDYDDAIFHNYDRHPNWVVKTFLKDKIQYLAKKADCIITGSPYLTSFFSNYNNNVIEIPTSIKFLKYEKFHGYSKEINKFSIGWIGSKSTSINMIALNEVIGFFNQNYPNVLFKLMGFDDKLKLKLRHRNVEFYRWSEEGEMEFLAGINIGLMPLEDTSFNRGKCGFKLIQYMAMGKPTISTPLEANVKINRDNKNLFANSPQEWVDGIITFLCNQEYCRRIGEKNIQIVKEYYSVEANSLQYIQLFKKI